MTSPPVVTSVAWYTEWSITNTSVRLLNQHIKITFWVLSVCPFQKSPTSRLRMLCIIKRIKCFHLLASRSQVRLFPKPTYWCLDWKSTLSRLLLLFPLRNRRRTQGTGVKKTAISLSNWWDLSPKRQFCSPVSGNQDSRNSSQWWRDIHRISRHKGCQNKVPNSIFLLTSDTKWRREPGLGFHQSGSAGPQWFGIDWLQHMMN